MSSVRVGRMVQGQGTGDDIFDWFIPKFQELINERPNFKGPDFLFYNRPLHLYLYLKTGNNPEGCFALWFSLRSRTATRLLTLCLLHPDDDSEKLDVSSTSSSTHQVMLTSSNSGLPGNLLPNGDLQIRCRIGLGQEPCSVAAKIIKEFQERNITDAVLVSQLMISFIFFKI